MAQVGGFLSALGQAFSGYGQDQQVRFQREQELAKLAMLQQGAGDAHLDALLARATNYPMIGNAGTGAPGAPGAPSPTIGTGQPPAPMPQQPIAPPQMVRRGDGIFPAPGTQPPPPAQPGAAPPTQQPGILDQLPTDAVNIPGYGTVDRWGGLKKQLLMKQLESNIDADSKVNVAQRTGEAAKNAADTNAATRSANEIKPGDPGYIQYMSTLDASRAAATLPVEMQRMVAQGQISLGNALVTEDARAKNEMARQGNQQTFEQAQQGRQQGFEQGQQAGAFANSSALANQNHRSSILGGLTAAPAQTNAPSARPRLTPEQVVRAARDPQYAAFLKVKGF